ncbi:hypothetical protein [Marinobacterium sp. xm-d-564]|uniref:hypothetical protein n=1 Tax=Marinobacterium sp. xm-d-564 TaxID=2497742 RepID=UPI0015695E6C|nr:hypothetical protein [Marinobacterium sp. xm-d-564]NRP60336.1 hypothetical protein [Marinobacterium sp. xm-d-564]
MENEEENDVFKEEPVTLKQILFGKLIFFGTLTIFMLFIPKNEYFQYFGYTVIIAIITALVSRMKLVSMSTTHYLLLGLTGYGIALWILAITQAFNK